MWSDFCKENGVAKRYQEASIATINKTKLISQTIINEGLAWCKDPSLMILSGLPGRGKTHFSYALCRHAIETWGWACVRWSKSKALDDQIVEDINRVGSAKNVIKCFSQIEILFLDDFGVDRGTERSERDFYEIIDKRWENNSPTVISTNLDPSEIEKAYGGRIYSRFKDFEWVLFDGPDLRGLNA
jgi:DNA replication protein DnaC